MQTRRILVGDVVGVFGVRGELKLRSHTDPVTAITNYSPWHVLQRGVETVVERPRCRSHGKGLVVQFPDVLDRDGAEAWIGAEVWVERDQLPALPEGQYYWADLEGLQVETIDGVALGSVSHLFSTGANDVLSVVGERERLIPYVSPDVVRSVDLEKRLVVVDWDPEF